MSVRIVVDSTADLAPETRSRVTVVPLSILFGTEEYIDGVTITHRQFYEKLIESDTLPTTSQAAPAAFANTFRSFVNSGDTVIAITISSRLSGTYQSAMLAAADYPGKVFVVDSKSVAVGSAILTERALDMADQGLSAEAIAAQLNRERDDVHVIAMFDTLEYLRRGGRISRTAAIAGGLLSLKPVVCLRDGAIEILGKARGSRQGNNLLIREIEASGGVDFTRPLMLGYTGLDDTLLQKYINDSAFLWQGNVDALRTTMIGSVVGTHAGPGAIAVAYFRKQPD